MLKHSGWAHAAGSRTGHYLDEGDPVCGYDPRTFWGEMDLKPEAPTDTCGACLTIVKRGGGSVPHSHRWVDASTLDGEAHACRCGANR